MRKYRNYYFFKIYFFLFFGGGGAGGGGSFVNIADIVKSTSCFNRRTKFMNTHWSNKSLTIVEARPCKWFCKTSLNARE